MTAPEPHAATVEEICAFLEVVPGNGLTSADVKTRLAKYGLNAIREERRKSNWAILLEQLKGILTILLSVAALVSFLAGDVAEGIAVSLVVLINAAIGFAVERKAIRSIEALKQLGKATTRVRRSGKIIKVPSEELVPGDIVILEGGDLVTADARLIAGNALRSDESLLTGESVSVSKHSDMIPAKTLLAERTNMVFKGTLIVAGTANAIVVATGAESELGRIALLAETAESEISPLDRQLKRLSRNFFWIAVVTTALIVGIGTLTGHEVIVMAKTGIALAVAAVPEGLPIVATLALGRGMWRLAERNALIKKLSAVETLGAVTVIFTDKTGTLTENRMTASDLVLDTGHYRIKDTSIARIDHKSLSADEDQDIMRRALRVSMLCVAAKTERNSAIIPTITDPTELAIFEMAQNVGDPAHKTEKEMIRLREEPFDPKVRMMAVIFSLDDDFLFTVKGAPESVIQVATGVRTSSGVRPLEASEKATWLEKTEELAAEGLRVLALAEKMAPEADADPYVDLVLIGLVGLRDPARAEAAPAVEAAKRAGIHVIMVTGDNAITGLNIARAVGIADETENRFCTGDQLSFSEDLSADQQRQLFETRIFARIDPKQKLQLIDFYQKAGEIVAMTGDGVNDAPALKKADIGIAMGLRGTEVAKQAAHMILRDDAFASIVAAIRQGRIIFENIRSFVVYLLSCNIAEIGVVALGTVSGLPLPLTPLQILFLNLVTDVFPALALGFGEGSSGVMEQPPRPPTEPILTRKHWMVILLHGFLIMMTVTGAFIWSYAYSGADIEKATTVAFLTLAFAQLWHVFNMRRRGAPLLKNQITRNPFVWAALVISSALLAIAIWYPPLARLLTLSLPDMLSWAVILLFSVFPSGVWILIERLPIIRSLDQGRQYESAQRPRRE